MGGIYHNKSPSTGFSLVWTCTFLLRWRLQWRLCWHRNFFWLSFYWNSRQWKCNIGNLANGCTNNEVCTKRDQTFICKYIVANVLLFEAHMCNSFIIFFVRKHCCVTILVQQIHLQYLELLQNKDVYSVVVRSHVDTNWSTS